MTDDTDTTDDDGQLTDSERELVDRAESLAATAGTTGLGRERATAATGAALVATERFLEGGADDFEAALMRSCADVVDAIEYRESGETATIDTVVRAQTAVDDLDLPDGDVLEDLRGAA